jgi:hypothetical protein
VITWPELGNAKTKVKGTLEGTEIAFQEYETQSADVVVPVNYIGKLDASKLIGTFKVSHVKSVASTKLNKRELKTLQEISNLI